MFKFSNNNFIIILKFKLESVKFDIVQIFRILYALNTN